MSVEKNEGNNSEQKFERVSNEWRYSPGISRDGRTPMIDRLFQEYGSSDTYHEPLDHNHKYLKIKNIDNPIRGKQIIAPGERYTSIMVGLSESMLDYLGMEYPVHPELTVVQYTDYYDREEVDLHQVKVPTFLDRGTIRNIAEQTFGNNPSPEELVRLLTVLPQFIVDVSLNQESLDIYCKRPVNGEHQDRDDFFLIVGEEGHPNFWVADEKIFLDEEWAGEIPNQYRLREEGDKAIFEISSNETDLTSLYPIRSNVYVKDDRGNNCNLPALSFGVELSSLFPEELSEDILDEFHRGNITDKAIRSYINPFLRLL